MKQFFLVVRIPFDAEDDRAAAAAQVELFNELRKPLARGFWLGSKIHVPPMPESGFAQLTALEPRGASENLRD